MDVYVVLCCAVLGKSISITEEEGLVGAVQLLFGTFVTECVRVCISCCCV